MCSFDKLATLKFALAQCRNWSREDVDRKLLNWWEEFRSCFPMLDVYMILDGHNGHARGLYILRQYFNLLQFTVRLSGKGADLLNACWSCAHIIQFTWDLITSPWNGRKLAAHISQSSYMYWRMSKTLICICIWSIQINDHASCLTCVLGVKI